MYVGICEGGSPCPRRNAACQRCAAPAHTCDRKTPGCEIARRLEHINRVVPSGMESTMLTASRRLLVSSTRTPRFASHRRARVAPLSRGSGSRPDPQRSLRQLSRLDRPRPTEGCRQPGRYSAVFAICRMPRPPPYTLTMTSGSCHQVCNLPPRLELQTAPAFRIVPPLRRADEAFPLWERDPPLPTGAARSGDPRTCPDQELLAPLHEKPST